MSGQTDATQMQFSLEWLAGAASTTPQLTVCNHGHLVVAGNSHWQPVAFDQTGRALICELTDRHD